MTIWQRLAIAFLKIASQVEVFIARSCIKSKTERDDELNLETKLQDFIKDQFVRTRFSCPDSGFQDEQIKAVYSVLKGLSKQHPNLADLLQNEIKLVKPIGEWVEKQQMENIGKSATACYEALIKQLTELQDPLDQVAQIFLQKVILQAQAECKDFEAKNSPSDMKSEDFNDFLYENIQDAQQKIEKLYRNTKETADKSIEEINNKVAESKSLISDIEKKVQKISDIADKAMKSADAILPNMLTTLGIFVAIIFTIVACYLNILLAKDSIAASGTAFSRPLEFMQFLLMGHIAFGVIFFLLYLVSKLSNYSLSCWCPRFEPNFKPTDTEEDKRNKQQACNCSECSQECSFPTRLRFRYPYVLGINFVFLLGYILLALWQVVNLYYRERLNEWILLNPWLSLAIFILLALLPIFIFCFTFWPKKRKGKTRKSN